MAASGYFLSAFVFVYVKSYSMPDAVASTVTFAAAAVFFTATVPPPGDRIAHPLGRFPKLMFSTTGRE